MKTITINIEDDDGYDFLRAIKNRMDCFEIDAGRAISDGDKEMHKYWKKKAERMKKIQEQIEKQIG